MPTDVVMPQMGESIAEGTIVRWIKSVGDSVERDEPLFEISTDKVDAEIPSPVAGILSEIRAHEGDTVPVNSVVAVIAPAGAAVGTAGPSATASPAPAAQDPAPPAPAASAHPPDASSASMTSAETPSPSPPWDAGDHATRQRSSPVVRRIAKEHNVDISKIDGTGIGGRVTKEDILAFVAESTAAQPRSAATAVPSTTAARPAQPVARKSGTPGTTVPMSVMRKKIAEHMIASRRTSAHVHTVFEVNFSRVAKLREAKKAEYERQGVKLTYLSFIMKATVDALRAVPILNASIDGPNVVYHQDINLGIAVALDWGLIVPVIRKADEKSVLGLSRSLADLAARARSKQLKPEEVAAGTFTITNPGAFGALFGTPIINQPQVAILDVGIIEKRAVVIDDAIAIRPMGYLSLGFDHRIIDGAIADEFMSHVKAALESWEQDV